MEYSLFHFLILISTKTFLQYINWVYINLVLKSHEPIVQQSRICNRKYSTMKTPVNQNYIP